MASLKVEELPTKLPVLPYKNRVLLPGGVIRVVCTSPSSIRLVETQLWQHKGPGVPLVGLVPAMESSSVRTNSPGLRQLGGTPAEIAEAKEGQGRSTGQRGGEGEKGGSVGLGQWLGVAASKFEPIDFQHGLGGPQPFLQDQLQWHKRGVVARALHVGKRSSGGARGRGSNYTLVLEGLCRFEVARLNSRGPFHVAEVDYRTEGPLGPAQEVQVARLEEELLHLGRKLAEASASGQEGSAQAIAFLQHARTAKEHGPHGISAAAEEEPAGGTPPGYLADVLVSCFELGFAPRLAVLDAVDLVPRLSLAVDILQQHQPLLRQQQEEEQGQTEDQDEGGTAALEAPDGTKDVQESMWYRTLPSSSKSVQQSQPKDFFNQRDSFTKGPSQLPGRGGSGRGIKGTPSRFDNEEDDEDDVATLERRLEAVGLPDNAWKHVRREIRRLRKMQPQQPGYSTSLQYLELLADLPWNNPPHNSPKGAVPPVKGVGPTRQEGGRAQGTEGLLTDAKVAPSPMAAYKIDVAAAKELLDKEHFGLDKVKQRIIEYIAVKKLKADAMGPVLCFVGPPGVGKTSLAASIASALGRKFVRIALGGVKDEADIRGHRRTYVGSMPGRIMEGIKRAGVNNPVMLLDEIDKTGTDARGDPASALLEVLDPEQNKCFTDHYVGLPFDLSRVVFVATANRTRPIPAPLLDRMEVIEIPGYTPEEKKRIALSHLIPRILANHGLTKQQLVIQPHVVDLVINRYTREAGVRTLSRHVAAIARAAAVKVAQSQRMPGITRALEAGPEEQQQQQQGGGGMVMEMEMGVQALGLKPQDIAEAMVEMEPIVATEDMVEAILGPSKFDGNEVATRVATPGVAVGLVWTAVGGEVQFVEASKMAGRGELHLTGQLGDVIKESAQIALTWVRSRAAELLIPDRIPGPRDQELVSVESGAHSLDQQQQQQLSAAAAAQGTTALPHGDPMSIKNRAQSCGGAMALESEGRFVGRTGGVLEAAASSGAPGHGMPRVYLESTGEQADTICQDDAASEEESSPRPSASRASRRKAGGSAGPAVGPVDFMANQDIHIHFPAGAVPKDGPSAGVTLVTALVSLLTQRCVRADTAMTGEITLRGLTLPVGGIKEKILAAHRCGVRRVILPHLNLKEVLSEVPAETLACVEILPTKRIEDVLQEAFDGGSPLLPRSKM